MRKGPGIGSPQADLGGVARISLGWGVGMKGLPVWAPDIPTYPWMGSTGEPRGIPTYPLGAVLCVTAVRSRNGLNIALRHNTCTK
jgi:hypothetical protein